MRGTQIGLGAQDINGIQRPKKINIARSKILDLAKKISAIPRLTYTHSAAAEYTTGGATTVSSHLTQLKWLRKQQWSARRYDG
jgi:hypothetical protein